MKTITRLNLAFLFAIICNHSAFSQTDTVALSLTRKYICANLKNYKSYYANEAIDQDFDPKKISKKAVISYETLINNNESSVIAVSVDDKNSFTDLYVYWIKKNGWKLMAIRTLRLPAMFHVLYDGFKDLDEEGIKLKYNEIIKKTSENDKSLTEEEVIEQVGTLDEFRTNIKTMNLTIASDKYLIEHFNQNKGKFNSLLTKIRQTYPDKTQSWKFDYKSEYKTFMEEILISSITNFDEQKIISFVIGGMSNNFVGYFYCENPVNLPKMDSKSYIVIKALGNGWYLYKTT